MRRISVGSAGPDETRSSPASLLITLAFLGVLGVEPAGSRAEGLSVESLAAEGLRGRRSEKQDIDAEVIDYLRTRNLSPPIMDRRQVERTQKHYDSHARGFVPQQRALKERSRGRAIPLKRFHNDVKRGLIEGYGFQVSSLLDLACGRGGDLNKWFDAEIGRVVGVDLSSREIDEAKKRYRELMRDIDSGKRRRGQREFMVEFSQTDQIGVKSPLDFGGQNKKFGAVSCMFAIHYFFESEDAARNLLKTVSESLVDGGHFFGVLPDGEKVQKMLSDRSSVSNPVFSLKWSRRTEESKDKPGSEFGCGYIFALTDTVTADIEDSEGSLEYLTFEKSLVRLAADYDLIPVTQYTHPRLRRLVSGPDSQTVFKHFAPQYVGPDARDLEEVSFLNCAFVFKKSHKAVGGESSPSKSSQLASGSLAAEVTQAAQGPDDLPRATDLGCEEGEPAVPTTKRHKFDGE